MNALVNLENGFNLVEQVCQTHKIRKVQAGPHQICPECAIEHVNESRKGDQARVDKMARMKRLDGAMMPERHNDSAFTNFKTNTQGQATALSECIAYAQALLNKCEKHANFIMVGSTGTGKTHLACATAKTLLKNGLFVRYITSEELAQRVMNAWDKDTKDQSEESVIYDICQYDLLILDEYGLHDRDKRLEIIHRVLTARYDRKKPTMLISNFTMKQLKVDLGDRLWSRFQHDGLKTVECKWADARVSP
ncbi:DNA replication protein [Acinetobacter proteolyticus]|uniref:DNA replication protein n=1 Tax=Acinetobacter proteolyticus TaxID=1776741 RepID=A0A653KBI3_9GAMM|nr:ATP-binding protein [Acinetobacter proteolyticus]VXA58255.1 DNA replication protein [Acinetobacter proteolyticus]